ncbi:polysaccharide deacetylase family protein [Rhizobium sp. 18065]|uniref:polysaccharide deacetylase family protein n=1 Tax=Rhizobium sp. 18065 TaxID=2681411 RepID=UPI00135BF067|nr:polysaccharide deacetylase family protein [Rhizobium sp. 18065]
MTKADFKRLLRRLAITGGLEVAHGLSKLGIMASARGRGIILTLHHVQPFRPAAFAPNRHLEITPEFLEETILQLKTAGFRFARLADVPALMAEDDPVAPFVVFTLDDGFRNNAEHAVPIFERHGVPCTIFVCKGLSERSHTMWWETAAALIGAKDHVTLDFDGGAIAFDTRTLSGKLGAFDHVCKQIFVGDETSAIERLNATAQSAGIDPHAIVADTVMNADELRALVTGHPLVSLGAHTVSHRGLGFLTDEVVLDELNQSADYVATLSGSRPTTFAYPYGDTRSATPKTAALADWAGFKLSVTTRPGTLCCDAMSAPQSLPRLSLNGFYQKPRYVTALVSGIPTKLAYGGC